MCTTYDEAIACSKDFREDRDCAVRAVSIVANMDYDYVRSIFCLKGRKRGKGTPHHVTEAVLAELQIKLEPVGRLPVSMVRNLELCMPKKGRYLVWTRGHILAVCDGKVQDWTEGRSHRIISVKKVCF